MNLPNKLTTIRILLVPIMVGTMLIGFPLHYLVSGLLFGAAALTDFFDGKIAREQKLITDFGKFLDPIADKILVLSALVCFLSLGLCDPIIIIVVLLREFVVTSVRLSAANKQKVVAANIWGKLKTVTQIIAIVAIFVMQLAFEVITLFINIDAALLDTLGLVFYITGEVLLWISTIFTILSGVKYIIDNKDFISLG